MFTHSISPHQDITNSISVGLTNSPTHDEYIHSSHDENIISMCLFSSGSIYVHDEKINRAKIYTK